LTFGALALLSCGGRSGLLGLEESSNGGVPASANRGTTAASGSANVGGTTAVSGSSNGGTTAAGASNGGAPLGGAGSSGGDSPIGQWVTLHHREPPAPAPGQNPFDYLGSNAVFADVWSDDPSRALVATLTPGYKAPSSGGVLRYEGGTMLPFAIGAEEHLYNPPRLVGLSLSDLWLAEDYLGLEHSDGSTWTHHTQPEAQLIWENAANDVWACSAVSSTESGTAHQLSHWDGSVWTKMALPNLDGFAPRGLWGRSASDMYVSGTQGTLMHWNGTTFEARVCSAGVTWSAVWGEAEAIWTVGDGGAVARWQGDSCLLLPTRDSLPGGLALRDLWGTGPDSLWIVGSGGSILHWNGSALELESSGVTADLTAVWGNASGVVWVVGSNETLLRRTF